MMMIHQRVDTMSHVKLSWSPAERFTFLRREFLYSVLFSFSVEQRILWFCDDKATYYVPSIVISNSLVEGALSLPNP